MRKSGTPGGSRSSPASAMLHVSTNGSLVINPHILELLATCPPYRITVSAYGAIEASYDALVRRSGAFRRFAAAWPRPWRPGCRCG